MRILRLKLLAVGIPIAALVAFLCFASAPLGAPSVRLTIVGFGTNKAGAFTVVRLTNAGPHSVSYLGYETNWPWYSYRFHALTGPTNHCPFWCGTGVQDYVLRARQSVDFQARTIEQREYQITLAYTLPSPLNRLRAIVPLWIADRLPMPKEHRIATSSLNGASAK